MLKMRITGRIYPSIKALYKNPLSCIQLGGKLTNWFPITAGVRQNDSLSPTLFAIFVNDLADDVREVNAGVYVGGTQIPILLYADDVVLISPNAVNLQKQLDALHTWCKKWCMDINQSN